MRFVPHLQGLDDQVTLYDRQLLQLTRKDDVVLRLQSIPGVGPLTASAIVASVANSTEFRIGREFAAWLGLVPRQHSTGGKTRLGHITKPAITTLDPCWFSVRALLFIASLDIRTDFPNGSRM